MSNNAARRGPLLAYPDGADGVRVAPDEVARRLGLSDPEVLLGWVPYEVPWLAAPALRGRSFMAGYQLAGPLGDGRLSYLPIRLSGIPPFVGDNPPDVAVVGGVRRGDQLAFKGTVGWAPAAAEAAAQVVVEVDEDAPDLGGPLIPGNIAAVVDRREQPGADTPAPRPPDAVDLAIGRNVVSVFPEEPTIQVGPGGIAEAIVASLTRPVHVWSGLVTDAVAELMARGLLLGSVTAGYVWGGGPVAELARAGRLKLDRIEHTHDLTHVSGIDRFVGCNTALQVGLDGSVNVERVGGRLVAGIGGHPDFCTAGTRSKGGMSVIALRSTTGRGASTIVAKVETVSTARCDVDVVVTEHGVADLRGVDDAERARRIAAVADPAHRPSLLG